MQRTLRRPVRAEVLCTTYSFRFEFFFLCIAIRTHMHTHRKQYKELWQLRATFEAEEEIKKATQAATDSNQKLEKLDSGIIHSRSV